MSAIANLLVGAGTMIEQFVKAQNMTTNMTDSSGNMTEAGDDSASISSRPGKGGGQQRAAMR